MAHGWEGIALKALGGKDFTLTVTGTHRITDHFLRVHLTDGGLLATLPPHPTAWVRLWFTAPDGKHHQRAYTLVEPDATDGTLAINVHLHDGTAARRLESARPGDTIEATVQGTGFTRPDPAPAHLHLVGDAASLPAIRTLLAEYPDTPATVHLEVQHADERDIPTGAHPHHEIRYVERDGDALTQAVLADWHTCENLAHDWFWIACEAGANRTLARWLRKDAGVPKQRVDAVAYWRTT